MKKYKLSASMLADMKTLRRAFAEAGFHVFTPAERYVRSDADFVAVPKSGDQVILVRIGKDRIETRKYINVFKGIHILTDTRPQLKNAVRQRHYLPEIPKGTSWRVFVKEQAEFDIIFPLTDYGW